MDQHDETDGTQTTIAQIARIAGVSIATVSRVLNNNPTVRRENVAKVERVLAEHGYTRSKARRGDYNVATIGLIVPDISNPWFPSLIKGVERLTRLYEMNLVLSDSENDARIEAANIATMTSRGIDGLILVPAHRHSEAAARLVDDGFPLVFLDRQIEARAVNVVTSSNTEGAYQATKYLLSLGHRRIAYIAGNEEIDTEWKRRDGYLRALRDASVPERSELIIRGNYVLEAARSSVSDLIRSRVPFSAIFASDDIMAYGAQLALSGHGLTIPDGVSLIGFDDIQYSSLVGLTTVAQSPFELGKNAVLLLNDILSGRVRGPKTIELPTSMVIRESCAPPAG